MNRDILRNLPEAELKIVRNSMYLHHLVTWIPHTEKTIISTPQIALDTYKAHCSVFSLPTSSGYENYPENYFFLFLQKNICCGYSLEAPRQGASNEYPQHIFSWRNKKKISIDKKYLI